MKKEGYCSGHQNQIPEINPDLIIPKDLEKKIENFISALSSVYCRQMTQIEKEYHKYDKLLVCFYQKSEEFGLKPLKTLIDQKTKIKPYYQELSKAYYLYQMLYSFMDWLTNSRPIFTLLIRRILQKKQSLGKTIYENIILYQQLMEATSPIQPYSIQPLLSRLCEDGLFKKFIIETNFATWERHWISIESGYSSKYQVINELRVQMDISNEAWNPKDKQLIMEIKEILQSYIEDLKQQVSFRKDILTNEICIWMEKNCDESLMQLFLEPANYNQVMLMISKIYTRKSIFYHKNLGQQIIQWKDQQWEDFVINEQLVNELSDIILYNQYQNVFKNVQIREGQLHLFGEL